MMYVCSFVRSFSPIARRNEKKRPRNALGCFRPWRGLGLKQGLVGPHNPIKIPLGPFVLALLTISAFSRVRAPDPHPFFPFFLHQPTPATHSTIIIFALQSNRLHFPLIH